MNSDPEQRLCESWSIGRLRPWLQMEAERELSDRLRGRVDASDIVQQTLLKAWQGESQFNGETHEERLAWLRTYLKNTIRDHHRRLFGSNKRGSGREQAATDLFAEGDPGLSQYAIERGPTVSGELVAAQEWIELERSLAQLSTKQKRVTTREQFLVTSGDKIVRQHAVYAPSGQRRLPFYVPKGEHRLVYAIREFLGTITETYSDLTNWGIDRKHSPKVWGDLAGISGFV